MLKILLTAALSGLITSPAVVYGQSEVHPSIKSDAAPSSLTALPPIPRGKSTSFGGSIRSFDPVRDQFMLNVAGQRPMRVLFDERTHVFRDGEKIQLRELGSEDHASVETMLDGVNVFAVSIHILTSSPEGQYEGRVLKYDPSSGALTIRASSSPDSMNVLIATGTKFSRVGQPQFASTQSGPADLQPGSLVTITFQSRKPGHAVVDAITVLAVPGSTFAFSGSVEAIDLHSGLLVLTDPTDEKDYQIHFDPALCPASRTLHPGDAVRVRATYSGAGFAAYELAAN